MKFKNLLLTVVTVFLAFIANSQTTVLIDPATDGGFELGSTSAANGWTEVNTTSSPYNAWWVGTAPTGIGSGNIAYISDDVAGATHNYSTSQPTVVHFYKDVTIPAGDTANLQFDIIVNGENNWDLLQVSLAPTSITPTASTTYPGSGTGAIVTGATVLGNYSILGTTSQTITIAIPTSILNNCSSAVTVRLIFSWKNDGTVGTQPPAAIDNISLISAPFNVTPSPTLGSFTIDNNSPTSGTNFNSFTDAISWLNLAYSSCAGINNPIVFNVTAGQTFTELPPVITATGTSANTITFQKSGSGANPILLATNGVGTNDGGIVIAGGDYFTFNGIDIQDNPANTTTTTQIEYGYLIRNASATDGASNNVIKNCNVSLNITRTTAIGILVSASTTGGGLTPTAVSGSNDNNLIDSVFVENCGLGGVLVTSGSSTYPGSNNQVLHSTIGAGYMGTPNGSIGTGSTIAYGIQFNNQSNFNIQYNKVRNIVSSGTKRGIYVFAAQGNSTVSHNIVQGIRNNSTTSTSSQRGMDLSLSTLTTIPPNSLNIYNNMISDILADYTGTATTTRVLIGTFLGSGSVNSTYNFDFNSISIDGTNSITASNICLELGGTTATYNIRNNILANYTGAQTGTAKHYSIRSTSTSAMGSANSVVDYNDYYLLDLTNGFTALTNTTDQATITDWDNAITTPSAPIDANSISIDPEFINPNKNLHTFSQNIDGSGNMLTITWVSDDIDGQVRNAPHDIGADDFTPPAIDAKLVELVNPILPPNCYTNCEPIDIKVINNGTSAINFATNPMNVSVNITGVNPQTYNTTITTGSLAVGDSMIVNLTNCYDMSAPGAYNFNPSVSVVSDGNPYNDTLPTITINISSSAGTAAINTPGICLGDTAILTLTGNSGLFQWQSSLDGINWVNETGPGSTSSPYVVSPNDTIFYRAVTCSSIFSNVVSLNVNDVTSPTATGDSRCGYGPLNLTASGSGIIKWYTDSIGGNLLHIGNTYSPSLGQTDTFWVENNLVSANGNVGKTINFSGSGTITLNRGLVFNTTTDIVLDSVMVYPIGTGTIQVALRDNANNIIATSSVISVTGSGVGVYIPLNFNISAGTGYRLTLNATTGFSDLWFDNTGNTFPYNSAGGEISITNGWTGTGTNTAYYYFYDWRFSKVCSSPRVPVVAIVTPTDSISVSPNPAFSCQGTPVNLTVSSSNPNYSYTWSPSTGLNTTTGTNVIANPTSNTTYVVSAIDNLGCTAYDTVSLTVTPVPVIDANAARTEICGNDTTQLSVNLISGGTNINQIGNGTSANTTTSYPAPYGNWYYGARHQFLILASELTAAGFSAGPINDIAFDVTAVNNSPALINFEIKMGLTSISNLTTFQTGLTTVFTSASYQPVTGWNTHVFPTPFQWDGTSNIIIETCFNNSSFTQNASTTYTTTPFTSAIYYRADMAGVCNQTSVTTSTNRPNMRFTQLNPVLYNWSPSANVSNSTISNPIGTPVANNTTTFIITVTDSLTGCPVVDSVTVQAYPVPQPNLGPDTTVCENQEFILTPGGGFNTYEWNTGSIGQLIVVNGISTPQTYWVDVTNSFGCSSRDSITVSVNPSPNINLGNDTTICKNHTLTLNAGSGFTSYQWNTGATTSSITIPQGSITSVYYVTVTNSFGCTDSDTILVTVNACTGIEELDGTEGIVLLYPNPNRGLFNLVVDIPGAENAQIEIINTQGRVVYNSTINNTVAYKEVIDLSGNASGIYYVRVISERFTNISKLMINN